MYVSSAVAANGRAAGRFFSSLLRRAACGALAALALAGTAAAQAPEAPPGATLDSLLQYARAHNPEYAAMKLEATAADERVYPAGALPDPKFRNEFRDITRMEEQNATLLPSRVGSNRYLVMQDVPWAGKRDLKREIARHDAEGAQGRALGTWSDVASRIKTAYAQLYYTRGSLGLTREILDLMTRLEKIAQVRYSGGLAAQQDVIRAQVEQTNMRNELVAMESEQHHLEVRLNGLLSRPAHAPLAPPERLRPVPAPSVLDYAALEARVRERNPQLYTDDARVRSAEKARELAYKNRYPDFTFGVAPIQYRNSVREWEVMVELNIPLQQKTRRSQERESEAMLAAARARKEATANQVLADLAQNVSALDAARRTEMLLDKSLLPQSDLTLQSALAAYQNGKVDFATLLDAQRAIRQAKQSRLKAQVEAQMRLAEIEKLLGEEL